MCNPTPHPTSRPIIDSSNACYILSVYACRVPLHGPVQFAINTGIMLDGHIPPQLPFSLRGSSPHVTHSSSGHTHLPSKRHLDRFSRFVWVPNALLCIMRCQWRSNPQNCLFPLGFLHPARGGPSHGHRQHAQEIWSRSRLWFRRYPSEHIHTHLDTHTQTCSSKYFATLPRATSKSSHRQY